MKTPPTSRRRVLAAAGAAAFAGCSRLGGSSYGPADLELALDVACDDDGDESVVTLSWEWAGGDGGNDPRDAALIYWDSDKWRYVGTITDETVEFETRAQNMGNDGVRFRHDDGAADASTRYRAAVKLDPTGDFDPRTRNVYGEFVHVRDRADGTPDEGWFGDLDREWDVAESNAEAGRACPEEES